MSYKLAIIPVVIVTFLALLMVKSGFIVCKGDGNPKDACNIINDILQYYSPRLENTEFDFTDYNWRKHLRDNYKVIKDEYFDYERVHKLPRLDYIDPNQRINDSEHQLEIPWSGTQIMLLINIKLIVFCSAVLMLELYGSETKIYQYFPRTRALLSNQLGLTVTTAMFSVLEAGKSIPPHRGHYYGITRYHLTLKTTRNPNNCVLIIHCEKTKRKKFYHWKEGQDILFDDTYLHEVHSSATHNETRIVLFLDIQKKFTHFIPNTINNLFLSLAKFHYRVVEVVKRQNDFTSIKPFV